jgi:hypothetical protein
MGRIEHFSDTPVCAVADRVSTRSDLPTRKSPAEAGLAIVVGGNQGRVHPAVLLTRERPVRSGYPTGGRRNIDARSTASFKAMPMYVSRTEISCA